MASAGAKKLTSNELAELRRTEREAMESILGSDFSVLEASAWKGAAAMPAYEIVLRPEEEAQKAHVAVVVHMAIPRNYPEAPPTVYVRTLDKRTHGVSAAHLDELNEVLNAHARKLCGAEMICELVSFAQEFISTHNSAPRVPGMEKLSLEQRMRERARAEHEVRRGTHQFLTQDAERRTRVAAREREEAEKQQSAHLAKQIETLTFQQKQAIRAERRRLRDAAIELPEPGNEARSEQMAALDAAALETSMLSLNVSGSVNEHTFGQVRRGPWLNDEPHAKVFLAVSEAAADTLCDLALVPISAPHYASPAGRRKLEDLEYELSRLTKVSVPELVRLLGWARVPVGPDNGGSLLCLVRERTSWHMGMLLAQCGTLPWSTVRGHLSTLLKGLQALHAARLVHRHVRLETIAMDGEHARLSGAGYRRWLHDLHRSNQLNLLPGNDETIPEGWRAPESLTSPLTYSAPRDLWNLGRCVCQMLFGVHVLTEFDSPEALLAAEDGGAARSILAMMMDRGNRSISAAAVAAAVAVADKAEPRMPRLAATPPHTPLSSASDAPRGAIGSFWQLRHTAPTLQPVSRYVSDFEEVEFLGKGAFGVVVKARNRLDERFYAVKKIQLSSSAAEEERTMREIMALSRLDHPHIVRYVTCWIERTYASVTPETASEPMTTSQQMDMSVLSRHDDFMSGEVDLALGLDEAFAPEADVGLSFIQFGDGESDDASEASLLSCASSTKPASTRILYIQMEYVENQTLSDALERGLSIDQAWHIFRQMLEALAHIASLGIIHRDLKPSNVLMDTNGDVKIGDFGLATTGRIDAGMRESVAPDSELTGGLGTFSYIAPEVLAKRGLTRYNHKVDMFSLGIIFFEMLAAQRYYKTTMERNQLLRELRQPNIQFPAKWDATRLSAQTAIIRALLDHDPSRRPTPMSMLRSPLLPPKMQDEYVQELIRLAANPTSVHRHQLMDALFSAPADDIRDYTFETGAQSDTDDVLVGIVCHFLRAVFHKRGAVPVRPPLLIPPNDVYAREAQAVRLLDRTGRVVLLPLDLTVPFARLCARSSHVRLKRYEIADVYRENLLAGGQPRTVLAASYDIVSRAPDPAAEAELLAVVDDILATPGFAGEPYVIEIGHEAIVRTFLSRFPARFHRSLLTAFPLLFAHGVESNVRKQMAQIGFSAAQLDELEAWNVRGDVEPTLRQLDALLTPDERNKLAAPLAHLVKIVKLAGALGVRRPLVLVPLLAPNATRYENGTVFSVVRYGKHRDVLAVGGRYDSLLRRFAFPQTDSRPHAAGLQLAVGKLVAVVARYQDVHLPRFLARAEEERSLGPWTPRRCECYIAAGAPGLLESRLALCRALWASGISADVQYEQAVGESPEVTAATCRSEGILFLILLRAHSPMLKIKEVLTRAEHEISRDELASFLQDRLARQRRVDVANGLHRPLAIDARAPVKNERIITPTTRPNMVHEVHVVWPGRGDRSRRSDRRLKPATRHALTDRALAEAVHLGEQLQSGAIPLIVVDVPPVLFPRLSTLGTDSDDVFRTFLSDEVTSAEEREYLKNIREQVLSALESAPRVLFYSSREGRSLLSR